MQLQFFTGFSFPFLVLFIIFTQQTSFTIRLRESLCVVFYENVFHLKGFYLTESKFVKLPNYITSSSSYYT